MELDYINLIFLIKKLNIQKLYKKLYKNYNLLHINLIKNSLLNIDQNFYRLIL